MSPYTKQLSVTMALLLGVCLVSTGCLKTRITTGQSPSQQEAELPWAHGFVNGLVPPINAPLNTAPTCDGAGVSEVFFRQTFVQGIAQGLTSSLYSPQRFTAICASGEGMATVPSSPSYRLRGDQSSPSDAASVRHGTASAKPDASSASKHE
jgi:hypothetical protein